MKNIISGFIITASMAFGSAQAGNLTTDELFDYLQSGDENSIESLERVELSRMEFSDVNSDSSHAYRASVSEVFAIINSD